MQKLNLKNTAAFRAQRAERVARFFRERRKVWFWKEEAVELPELDFEFANQVVSLSDAAGRKVREDYDVRAAVAAVTQLNSFLIENLEQLSANADVLKEKVGWKELFGQTLGPSDHRELLVLGLSESYLLFAFASDKFADLLDQKFASEFLRQAIQEPMDSLLTKNVVDILAIGADREGLAVTGALRDLTGVLCDQIQTKNSTPLDGDFESMEGLLGLLEWWAQRLPFAEDSPKLCRFLTRLLSLDIPDIHFKKAAEILMVCWGRQTELIEAFNYRPTFKRILKVIGNYVDEEVLVPAFQLVGNWLASKSKWGPAEEAVLSPADVDLLFLHCFHFLESINGKFTAQEKCMTLIKNLIFTLITNTIRKNFPRLFEILAQKLSKFSLLKKDAATVSLLSLAKGIFEKTKIEEQIGLSTQNLPFLASLFAVLGPHESVQITLLSLHNILTFLSIDKIIFQKVQFKPSKEFILEKGLLTKLAACEQNQDVRVVNLARVVTREYFAEETPKFGVQIE